MGRYINPDEPYDEETKEFLRARSRIDEIVENERRFPPDGEAEPHEAAGFMPTKVGYDYQKQADKVEDAGGLEIQRIPTDDQGRPMVAEYGYVEGIIHEGELPAESPEDEGKPSDDTATTANDAGDDNSDENSIDDDIIDPLLELNVEQLKAKLKELDEPVSGNKDELIDRLANRLQDDRDKANAATA